MAKIVLFTQVYENYAFDEEGNLGTGVNAYWKAKGGSEYVVKNIDINQATVIATLAAGQIGQDNEMFRETVISWSLVSDDYMTEFERQQLEYDGRITCPAYEITV